jgi:arylsulfatase
MVGRIALGLGAMLATTFGQAAESSSRRPLNIIFIICDQETYRLAAAADYQLPARRALRDHGVTFRNHYIAAAMCSPSRAAFLTGQPPQVNGVFDNMEYPYVPNMNRDKPSMGTTMKALGYKTAYFGKFEMDRKLLHAHRSINYTNSLESYGFDVFGSGGDVASGPRSGYDHDSDTAGEGVSWLRTHAGPTRASGQNFFLVVSFLNPHDIMYADANVPGQPPVQRPVSPPTIPPVPQNALYTPLWTFAPSPSLSESLAAPGMPAAVAEYHKGWSGVFGQIPADRRDMWRIFYNYYLNCLRDNDRKLQQVVDAIDELDLWKDTVVVMSADHGEMGGSHGGIRGKGPFCYEANAHVPLVIASPDCKPGTNCSALTSHLDLLPTFVGLARTPAAKRPAAIKALPGKDFSPLLANPKKAAVDASRRGVLFNYVALSTVDANFQIETMSARYAGKKSGPPISQINLKNRGFLAFAFDGRYKFARYYAPSAFNTPKTVEQILKFNDVQLFDLESDPDEMQNLALDPEKNSETMLRMNALLNELMANEVGVNDGSFLPEQVRPRKPVVMN